jgi:transposase
MEEVLDIYERAYDPRLPVICFDERPCQLIGDVVAPIPMKPGRAERQDYHYRRNGTCCIMIAFEPLAGTRIIEVKQRRTKKDYAHFMKKLQAAYPDAEKIILVQDNLNTHNPSSFYETFPSETAFRLSQRFQMVYTPKKASWLNMAEIDLSALSKQCLDRRIGDVKTLSKEVHAWANERNHHKVTVKWQFTKNDAREKLDRHYHGIRN